MKSYYGSRVAVFFDENTFRVVPAPTTKHFAADPIHLQGIKAVLLRFIKRQVKRAFQPSISLACDNYALSLLKSFHFGYLPWTSAAMRPSALCALLNEILINQRRMIVEFGAGISTLHVARLMQETQGTLVSFEHDRAWCEAVSSMIEQHNLTDSVKVIHAPLENCSCSLDGCKWYNSNVVRRELAGKVLDGVIVDGPPANGSGIHLARFPAVPVTSEYLGDTFFIFLDDIGRSGESQIFKEWEQLLQVTGSKEPNAGQFGIIRKGGGFAIKIWEPD